MRERSAAEARGREETPRVHWCRIGLTISLIPPAPDKLVSIDRGPRTLRATVCAPWPMVVMAAAYLFGNQPWLREVLGWVRRLLSW